jgi:hypothetical protein
MRPLPHSAHRKFVETEGWEKKSTARRAGATGDHHRYTLTLATGDVLSTRVSHGSGQINDPGAVAHILRDQLAVSEADFWRCVEKGTLPPRPQPSAPPVQGPPLDAKLARNLLRKVGLTQAEVATLSKQDTVLIWQQWLAEQPSD